MGQDRISNGDCDGERVKREEWVRISAALSLSQVGEKSGQKLSSHVMEKSEKSISINATTSNDLIFIVIGW